MESRLNFYENNVVEIVGNVDRRHFWPSKSSHGWSVFVKMSDTLSAVNFLTSCILGGFGVLLNLIALFVICDWNLNKRKQFILIRSLTVVDLLSCGSAIVYALPFLQSITVPSGNWGDFLCALVFSRFVFYTLSAVSAWHLVMISFERYLSIIHTDWYDLHFTRFMNFLMIVISWAIGVYTMNYNLWAYRENNGTCILEWPEPMAWEVYAGVNEFVLMVIFPIFIMSFFYYSVFQRYKEFSAFYSSAPVALEITSGTQDIKNPRSVRLTLLVLMFAYIVSWFPNEILWLLYSVGLADDDVYTKAPSFVTQLLVNVNAVCNPILYASSYSEFRYLFKTKAINIGTRIFGFLSCRKFRKRKKVHSIQERHPTASNSGGYRVTSLTPPSELPDIYENPQMSDVESSIERSDYRYKAPLDSF